MDHGDANDQAELLLREVDEAITSGRAMAALDDLLSRAGAMCDGRVDQAMVRLRNAAFAHIDRRSGRPRWPASFDDPFPGVTEIPTVEPRRLSGELIGGAPLADGERWFSPFQVGARQAQIFNSDAFVRTVDSPGAVREVAALFERSGVTRAVTEYFEERPVMIANKWVLRLSPTGKLTTDFHQDGAFLGKGIRTVNCWIPLSPCGPGTGKPAMDLVPARYGEVLSNDGAAFDWACTEASVMGAAGDVPLASPTFQPGDALFFDEMLPHRTSVGLDLTERYAIESWFAAPSHLPAKQIPVVL